MAHDRSLEDPALDLGRALRAQGHDDLAALLLEVLPETDAVRDDAHRALVAERLDRVAAAPDVAPDLRAAAVRLAGLATADARVRHGRTGTVWIAWTSEDDDVAEDAGSEEGEEGVEGVEGAEGAEGAEAGYWVVWDWSDEHDSWSEDGPFFIDLRDALAWARERADAVVVRPAWDEGTYYWAGRGRDPHDRPPLDESRA